MRNISDLVKNQRTKLGLTMEEVGEKAKLSQGFVSKLEKGDYSAESLSLDTIIRLADALKLKVKDFLDDLKVIESDQAPSLNVYLRQKYDIQNTKDVQMIEDIINRFINNKQ